MNREELLTYDRLRSVSFSWRKFIKSIFDLFWVYDLSRHQYEYGLKTLMVIGPYGREDYYNILSSYINDDCSILDLYRSSKKFVVPKLNLFLEVMESHKDLRLSRRIYLSLRSTHYGSLEREFRDFKVEHYESFIFFSASHPYEATIAESVIGCTHRIGLQHAFYVDFSENQLDSLPYMYMPVDELWVWGVHHRMKFESFFPNLKIIERPPSNVSFPQNIVFSGEAKVLVLLARPIFKLDNLKLLKILSNFPEYRFEVKVHPKDSISYYQEMIKGVFNIEFIRTSVSIKNNFELSSFYGFAISFNSTAYIDIYYSGLRCLYFENGNSDFSYRVHVSDSFFNSVTFAICIRKLNEVSEDVWNEINKNLLLVYAL